VLEQIWSTVVDTAKQGQLSAPEWLVTQRQVFFRLAVAAMCSGAAFRSSADVYLQRTLGDPADLLPAFCARRLPAHASGVGPDVVQLAPLLDDTSSTA
jgi:hypothetical protein